MDKCCLTIDICWFLFFTDNFLSIFYGGIMQDYIFSNDFSRNLDAMIYTCGYETCEPGHSYGPVVRSGYLIHYILKPMDISINYQRAMHFSSARILLFITKQINLHPGPIHGLDFRE